MMGDINLHEVKECKKCGFTGPIHNGKTYNFYKDGTYKKDGTPRTRNDCAACFKGTRKSWETTIREQVRQYKAARCCEKCGRRGYWRLEFHHPDDNKEFSIGNMAGRMSWERVLAEIKKCMLLCKICHCDIHHYEKERKCLEEAILTNKSCALTDLKCLSRRTKMPIASPG